jgi:hypothetical protein
MRRMLWLSLSAIALLMGFAWSKGHTTLELMGSAIIYFAVFMALGMLYLAPGFLALHRGHHNTTAIVILNALAGWTLLGWIGSMVWASTVGPQTPDPTPRHAGMRVGGLVLGLFGIMLVGYGVRQFGSLEAIIHATLALFGVSFMPFLLGWIPLLAGSACLWGSIKLLKRSGFFNDWA